MSRDGAYFVEVFVEGMHGSRECAFARARLSEIPTDTRLKITIVEDGKSKDVAFWGRSCMDIWLKRSSLAAVVFKGPGDFTEDVGTYKVTIELMRDPNFCYAQMSSMLYMGLDLERKHGVDLPQWLLGSPKTIQNTGSLWNEVKDHPPAIKLFQDFMEASTLDEGQEKAAWQSFKSGEGVEVIWGAGRTGKTYLLNALVTGHVLVGRMEGIKKRQVLITAPTIAGVLNVARQFNTKRVRNGSRDVKVCILSDAPSPTDDVDREASSPEMRAFCDYAERLAPKVGEVFLFGGEGSLYDFCFHDRLRQSIREWKASRSLGKLNQIAEAFYHARAVLESRKATEADKIAARARRAQTLDLLTDESFRQVDVVICTEPKEQEKVDSSGKSDSRRC